MKEYDEGAEGKRVRVIPDSDQKAIANQMEKDVSNNSEGIVIEQDKVSLSRRPLKSCLKGSNSSTNREMSASNHQQSIETNNGGSAFERRRIKHNIFQLPLGATYAQDGVLFFCDIPKARIKAG